MPTARVQARRFPIGIVVVMGMLIGTLFTPPVLPIFCILIAREHRAAVTPRPELGRAVEASSEVA